ncbi:MAG: ABC transporter ATP-binding protein [Planctomycetes bacterium]|nr:ABC transporter ATP-binding protein [Planctomycetota bacterium]
MNTVTVSGIEKTFGTVRALRGLNVEFPEGPVGLLGPNGAGKSTLLKVLLGLLTPDSGTAQVLGLDVTADPTEVRRLVGYMPEMDAFLPGLTGAEAVRFAGVMCGLPAGHAQRRAHEILYYVGLGEARFRRAEQYSTGMRQRLRLAQALVHDPQLVFLDEPTNGLDPAGRDEILELIRDLTRKHRKSVILCSHLLFDVESVCDNVVVLRSGQVALQGTIADVKKLERGTYRVRVLGDRDAFIGAIEREGAAVVDRTGETLSIRVPDGADAKLVFRAAAASKVVVRELSTMERNLEGAFLRAMADGDAAAAAATAKGTAR